MTTSSDKDPAAPEGPTQEPDQPDEVATPLQFADTEDISAKAPKRARRAPPGLYREASSSSESEEADDPVEEDKESAEYSFSSQAELSGKIKPKVTHLIYKNEGMHFPGLVTKVTKKYLILRTMHKSDLKTWSYGSESGTKTCKLSDVTDLIPPPVPANSRGQYHVQKIGVYWQV